MPNTFLPNIIGVTQVANEEGLYRHRTSMQVNLVGGYCEKGYLYN